MVLPISLLGADYSAASECRMGISKIPDCFHDILQNIQSAIVGEGIRAARVSPASSMLRLTAPAFGYPEEYKTDMEILVLCTTRISQKLSGINPDSIVICRFTVAVDMLVEKPGMVRAPYRVPVESRVRMKQSKKWLISFPVFWMVPVGSKVSDAGYGSRHAPYIPNTLKKDKRAGSM
ncbi:hypothetical protein [Thiolapillus brandeum]|uniref:Uncharacterized protein n=1 Tax=Thiolapillus brandeum TaxID=1076588 RepID=A0A7U6GJV7_9GAMM|nr:hypothetical protein [Thiolapillus brandeum]BAO44929.1 hypothetical protein TBH_C2015 [Thiolapillus brandeum]